MATRKYTNNGSGTLLAAITNAQTGLTLSSGQGAEFPSLSGSDWFIGTLDSGSGTVEIVKVTARSTDYLTIVRAQEGTSNSAFSAGAKFELRATAASFSGLGIVAPGNLATGDILYASNTTTVAGLAAVASGQVLASAGTSTAPAYTANPSITNATIAGSLTFSEISAPGSPGANKIRLYAGEAGLNGSALLTKDENGNVNLLGYTRLVGSGTEVATIGGVIDSAFGSVGTGADTNQTTLHTRTIAANAIVSGGDAVRIRAHGLLAANTGAKTVRIRVAGTTVLGSGTVTTSNATWEADFRIIRLTSTTADIVGAFRIGAAAGAIGAATVHRTPGTTTPSVTFANAWTVVITGHNGVARANDVTCRHSAAIFEPLP